MLIKKKGLGRVEKQRLIRLLKRTENHYDIVLVRRRGKPTSRFFKFGYYKLVRNVREQHTILSLDFDKMSDFLSEGVKLDRSLFKLICY